MEKIKSFQINHDLLKQGVYVSRMDGDITTYDLRFKLPNGGDYLENAALHTLEHLAATFLRNSSYSENIVYFGPMGCRTGFYLLTRGLENTQIAALLQDTMRFIKDFSGVIPGSTAVECGNAAEHDLTGAKTEAEKFLPFCGTVTEYPTEN